MMDLERESEVLRWPIAVLTLIALVFVLLAAWARVLVPARQPVRVRDLVIRANRP